MRVPCTFWLNMIILTTNSFYYLTVYFVLPIPIKLAQANNDKFIFIICWQPNYLSSQTKEHEHKTSWYSKSCLFMVLINFLWNVMQISWTNKYESVEPSKFQMILHRITWMIGFCHELLNHYLIVVNVTFVHTRKIWVHIARHTLP